LNTPTLVLDKTIYDLGEIRLGSQNKAVFTLKNIGGGTLRISHIKNCCGVVAKLDKTELLPGSQKRSQDDFC